MPGQVFTESENSEDDDDTVTQVASYGQQQNVQVNYDPLVSRR